MSNDAGRDVLALNVGSAALKFGFYTVDASGAACWSPAQKKRSATPKRRCGASVNTRMGLTPTGRVTLPLDSQSDCERVVAMARRDGRESVGCIVLGRGEDEQHVRAWSATAAGVSGFIGFAVGRTTFREPLIALRDEMITREAAVRG